MNDQSELAELFQRLGRELNTTASLDEVFTTITHNACASVPGCRHAAISRGRRGRFETVAATSPLPPQVDQVQYDLNSGPCVDAVLEDAVFRVGDLRNNTRWPEFGRRADEQFGIRSMLSTRLFLEDDDMLVGLNMYSEEPDAFDEADQTVAALFATHGALAVTSARRQDKVKNLERALETSRRIGIALGILMATYKVTDDQAFDLLRIASQTRQRKLHELAEDVVTTGALELPATPSPRAPARG